MRDISFYHFLRLNLIFRKPNQNVADQIEENSLAVSKVLNPRVPRRYEVSFFSYIFFVIFELSGDDASDRFALETNSGDLTKRHTFLIVLK